MRYTKEKLYELLPAIYRQRDSENGKPLEALLSIIAEQIKIIEEDIEGLYNNWFIETSDEWVVAYISDLVASKGLKLPRQASKFSQRAYVANTIHYRRRKGTLAILEQLAIDITHWGAKAVEFFQILSITQNINHLRQGNYRTPDLRNRDVLEFLDTPFDTVSHTVDVRHINNERGCYNIPNIGIFLWRLQSYPVENGPAYEHGDGNIFNGRFSFSQLGYDIPLFNYPHPLTEKSSESSLPEGAYIAAPIRRYSLYKNIGIYYGVKDDNNNNKDDPTSAAASIKVKVNDLLINPSNISVCDLSLWDRNDWKYRPHAGKIAIDPQLGRIYFPYVFVWEAVGGMSDIENQRLRKFLAGKFMVSWVEDNTANIKKSDDGKTITISKEPNNLILITLSADEKNANIQINNMQDKFTLFNDNGQKYAYYFSDGIAPKVNVTYYYGFSSDMGGGPYERLDESEPPLSVTNKIKHYKIRKKNLSLSLPSDRTDTYYKSINDALNKWIEEGRDNAIFEIMDNEFYPEKNINIIVPEGIWINIKSSQRLRPTLKLKESLQITAGKGSSIIFDGLLFDNKDTDILISIRNGDLRSLNIRHCTLVPERISDGDAGGGNPATNRSLKINGDLYILFTWENISENVINEDIDRLKDFVQKNFDIDLKGNSFHFIKSPDKKIISLLDGTNPVLSFTLDEEQESVELMIGNKVVFTFNVKRTIDGKLNIYFNGRNDELKVIFDHTICGRIETTQSDALLSIGDSIIDGKGNTNAISCYQILVENSTIFGKVNTTNLNLASNCIFTDTLTVERRQKGCVRFSYIPEQSSVPRQYHCQPNFSSTDDKASSPPIQPKTIHPRFTSTIYGDPGYAQIHKSTGKEIFEGADNGSEMGVFNKLYQAQRIESLRLSFDEYLRFGLEAGIFLIT